MSEVLKPGSQQYIDAAVGQAKQEKLANGSTYAEIPGFRGVYANEATPEATRNTLGRVVKGWVSLRQEKGFPVPVIEQRVDPKTGEVRNVIQPPAQPKPRK